MRKQKRTIYIYCVYFPTSGKYYIGQTWNLKKRFSSHRIANSLIGKALRKYDNWQRSILHTCKNKDVANRIEIEEIRNFNSVVPNGYNLTRGGEGGDYWQGKKRPDISKSNKRRTGEKHPTQSEFMKGNKNTLGHKLSKEHRKKISKAQIGRKHSEETKRKMSENNAMKRPEVAAKISAIKKRDQFGKKNPAYKHGKCMRKVKV